MAFEKNTALLAEWASQSMFSGPDGAKYMAEFRKFTRTEDEPERVKLLQHLFNDAIARLDTIQLWENGDVPAWREEIPLQNKPQIAFFPAPDGGKHGCVLVAPGGGFNCKAVGTEGYPVIWRLLNAGFSCALLDYRVKPYSRYVSLADALRAVRVLRYNADRLNILPDKIGMIGGSAGGNLTCLTGVHWDAGDPSAADPVERVSSRIDAGLVMYGTFTAVSWPASALGGAGRKANDGERSEVSKIALGITQSDEVTREAPQNAGALVSVYMDTDRKSKYFFSPEKWVRTETPPFFLWQTCDMDDPRNMFCFAKELADAGVRFEAHIYPFGPHGMALADGNGLGRGDSHVAHWSEQAIEWLKIYNFDGENIR